MGARDTAELEYVVRHLASLERASASEGEREAAQWIAGRLREAGLEAEIEEERAHGTYWVPFGLLTALATLGGIAALRGRRHVGVIAGALGAAGVWDEVGGARQRLRRTLLPHRPTWNVVAHAGDPRARQTVVILAHHDAARSGAIFNPALLEGIARVAPGFVERADTSPALFRLILAGPAAVALGSLLRSRRLTFAGTLVAAGSLLAFADIGASETVPGANDNLTGVATIVALARRLHEGAPRNLRVILLSCGSEESFQEGVTAYLRRHGVDLDPASTTALVIDTVGSPELCVPEGEGMIAMRDYTTELKDRMSAAARELGITIHRGTRFAFSTDAVPWQLRGSPNVMLGSVTELRAPANYHWPTDHADNVDYETVADALDVVEHVLRGLDDDS